MAEFLENNLKPKPLPHDVDAGFNAFGKFVSPERRAMAYKHIKEMGVKLNDDARTCVNAMAEEISRDQPYEAMKIGMQYVDLTGTYRLIAVLCCG